MRTRSALELINTIENNCDIEFLRIGDFNAWPLVRLSIWSELVTSENELAISKWKLIGQHNFTTIINYASDQLLLKFPNRLKFLMYRWARYSEILMIGRPSHAQFVAGFENEFDRVLDPIAETLQSKFVVSSTVLGANTSRKSDKTRLRLVFNGPTTKITGLTESGLMHELERHNLNLTSLKARFSQSTDLFWRGFYSFNHIVNRSTVLNKVFVSVWYSPDMIGIIASARQANIFVTDVQHGLDPTNAMGSWRISKIPIDGYELVPDRFWRWGSDIGETVNHTINRSDDHSSVVGGYPWIHFWHSLQRTKIDPDENTPKKSYKRQLLFPIRSPYGESKERIPDFLLDFLRIPHPDTIVVLRLHPNDIYGYKYLKHRLSGQLQTAYRISDAGSDMYQSIAESSHLLTAFSAVCIEGLAFGIGILLFGADAFVNYKTLIEDRTFLWTNGNLEDLENFMNTSHNANSKTHDFIVSSKDLTTSTANKLVSLAKTRKPFR